MPLSSVHTYFECSYPGRPCWLSCCRAGNCPWFPVHWKQMSLGFLSFWLSLLLSHRCYCPQSDRSHHYPYFQCYQCRTLSCLVRQSDRTVCQSHWMFLIPQQSLQACQRKSQTDCLAQSFPRTGCLLHSAVLPVGWHPVLGSMEWTGWEPLRDWGLPSPLPPEAAVVPHRHWAWCTVAVRDSQLPSVCWGLAEVAGQQGHCSKAPSDCCCIATLPVRMPWVGPVQSSAAGRCSAAATSCQAGRRRYAELWTLAYSPLQACNMAVLDCMLMKQFLTWIW